MDNGHHNRYRDPPPLVGLTCTPIPFFIFPEDLTGIVELLRGFGRRGTAVKKDKDKACKK